MARKPREDDKHPEEIDPRHILEVARMYHFAYRLLRNPPPPDIAPRPPEWYLVPSCAVGAFALELLFKYLLALEGTLAKMLLAGERRHDPSWLFEKLSPGKRDLIANQIAKLGGSIRRENLPSEFAKFDGLFEAWRYIFEKKARYQDLDALDRVLAVMDSVATEARASVA